MATYKNIGGSMNVGIPVLILLCSLIGMSLCGLCGDRKKVPSTTDKKFIQDVLDETNKKRKEHGADPLKINDELCEMAQNAANEAAAAGGPTSASDPTQCSESFLAGAANCFGASVVSYWYAGAKKYDYSQNEYQQGTMNFVELVWKDSKEWCIAKALDSAGSQAYVIALYHPAGNQFGQYKANVLPPGTKGSGKDDGSTGSLRGRNGDKYVTDDDNGTGTPSTLKNSPILILTILGTVLFQFI